MKRHQSGLELAPESAPELASEPEGAGPGVDLRLMPFAVGLWVSEAAVLGRSGQESGPTPGDLARTLGIGGLVVLVAFAVVAMIGRRRWVGCGNSGAGVRPTFSAVVVLVVGALAGGVLAVAHSAALDVEPIPELVRSRSSVEAIVVPRTEPRLYRTGGGSGSMRRRWSARADVIELRSGERVSELRAPVVVQGFTTPRGAAESVLPGATVRVRGVLEQGRAARPESARLLVQGEPEVVAPEPWYQRWAGQIRASLRNASAGLAPDAGGLLPGLAVGDERALPPELADAMRSVGMSHLTAVSGSNLAIVTGLVLLLLRACRLPRPMAVGMAAVAMLGFVVVVGFEPSVERAAVMGGIALLAIGLGRRRVGLSALLAAIALLLLVDPWLALSWGFALSVAATAGLLVVLGRSRDGRRNRAEDRTPRTRKLIKDALAVAIVCQLATAPLIAAMGNGLSLVGFLANGLATPAVPVATVLGLLAAVAGLWAPGLAEILAHGAGWGTAWIAGVARFASELPGATVPWPEGAAGALFLGAIIAAGALLFRWLRGRWRAFQGERPATHLLGRTSHSSGPKWIILVVGVVAGALLLARLASTVTNPSWPPAQWAVVFCDVGQGDATVLKSGEGHAVVVDVGPEPSRVDRCLRTLEISVIDLLVITHFHADHVMGLPGALRGRAVGRVVMSPIRDPPDGARQVERWLADGHLMAVAAAVGEEGRVGTVGYRIVWPSRRIDTGSIPNNASVTLLAEVDGISLLLPGDLEPAAQQALMDSVPAPGVDVIKIPHHGSRFQDPDLITWAGSRVAVASAGQGNDYGHPATETLAAWRQAGAVVMRTDADGDVAVGPEREIPEEAPPAIGIWARNRGE
ncbi:MAG: ComEC/Rec2 family competence protein [Candidatus Nanopelagicales bacterium]|nr:ComEC/Rec2 family competence protein [Candidatus Nanopelagicales bacterium]